MKRKLITLLAAGGLVSGLLLAVVQPALASPQGVRQSPDRLDNVSTCKSSKISKFAGETLYFGSGPTARGVQGTINPQSGYFSMCSGWATDGNSDGVMAWVQMMNVSNGAYLQIGIISCRDTGFFPIPQCHGGATSPHWYIETLNCSIIKSADDYDLGATDTAPHEYTINHSPGADHWNLFIDNVVRGTVADSAAPCLDPDTSGNHLTASWVGETWDYGGDSLGTCCTHFLDWTVNQYTQVGVSGWHNTYTAQSECDIKTGNNACYSPGGNPFSFYTVN